MAATDYFRITQQLYLTFLGRPADPAGLQAFAARLDAIAAPTDLAGLNIAYKNSPALKSLVDTLGHSVEAASVLGAGGDYLNFVIQAYEQLLNRNPDLEGLLYWSKALASGSLSRGDLAMHMAAAVFTNTSQPVQAELDRATVNTKIDAALRFTAAFDTPEKAATFSGVHAAFTARYLFNEIDGNLARAGWEQWVDGRVADILRSLPPGRDLFISGTANNDVIELGVETAAGGMGGNDTFVVVGPHQSNINRYPTITDLSPGDRIAFEDRGDYTKTTLGAKVVVAAGEGYTELYMAAIAGSKPGELSWFHHSGNTFVVNDVSAGPIYESDTNGIVRLIGTLDLSASTVTDTGVLTYIAA